MGVLQRGLPRPRTTNVEMDPHQDENLMFPEGKQPKKKRKIKRQEFTDEQLANARKLLKEEIKVVQDLRGYKKDPEKEKEEFDDFCNKLKSSNDQVMFVPA